MVELFDAQTPGGGKQIKADEVLRPADSPDSVPTHPRALSDEAQVLLARNYTLSQQRQNFDRGAPTAVDLVGEAGYSAIYQGVQSPLVSLGQLSDKALSGAGLKTKIADIVNVLPAPEAEKFGTARWHAQQIGGGAGMILPFVATKGLLAKGGLSFAARTEASVIAGSRLVSATNAGLIADGALTGFVYDFALRPVDKPDMDKFWEARAKHGLTGAATFGTLTAGSIALRNLTRPLAAGLTEAPKATRLAYDVGMGALPGIPAGVVSADANSLLTKGQLATNEERMQGAYTMFMAGGSLSVLHAIPGSKVPLSEIAKQNYEQHAGRTNLQSMLFDRGNRLTERSGNSLDATLGTGTNGFRVGRAMASADAEKIAQPMDVEVAVPKEMVGTLQRGVDLAFKASDANATPQQVAEFFQFARGDGLSLKGTMHEVAKQYASEDPHMMTLIREAYMPPEGVVNRVSSGDIKLQTAGATTDQYQRWGQFMQIVREMPQDVDGYINFRHDVFRWLNNNKDLHDWALQYGQQNRYSKVAGPLDYYFGTQNLNRFIAAEGNNAGTNNGNGSGVSSIERAVTSSNGLFDGSNVSVEFDAKMLGVADGGKQNPIVDAVVSSKEFKPANDAPPKPANDSVAPIGEVVASQRSQGQRNDLEQRMIGLERGAPSRQKIDAAVLAERIGEMSTEQFAQWLDYAYSTPKGAAPGSMNLSTLMISQKGALINPNVVESYLRYRGQEVPPRDGAVEIPLESIRQYLAKPEPIAGDKPLADWFKFYVEARFAQADQKAPGESADATLKRALPHWLTSQLKADYVQDPKLFGRMPTYSDQLPSTLVQRLEAARLASPPKPAERPESKRPSDTLDQRMERLNEIANISDPIIRERLLELGPKDHASVRSVTQKLNPERSAPEYQELLRLVLPEATNLKDVKLLLDSIYFGNKTNRADRGSDEAKANLQLAMATAEQLVPQSNPNYGRVQEIVGDMISGKIRDPQPPRDGGDGPGGRGSKGENGNQRGVKDREPANDNNQGQVGNEARRRGVLPKAFVQAFVDPSATQVTDGQFTTDIVSHSNAKTVVGEARPAAQKLAAQQLVEKTAQQTLQNQQTLLAASIAARQAQEARVASAPIADAPLVTKIPAVNINAFAPPKFTTFAPGSIRSGRRRF